jgi:hypothetical protein
MHIYVVKMTNEYIPYSYFLYMVKVPTIYFLSKFSEFSINYCPYLH